MNPIETTIYVDVDGTLLSGELDEQFIANGRDVEWYGRQYRVDLAVNYSLVYRLLTLKAKGHRLVLWTNRNEAKTEMTKRNLGKVWYMFDEHRFYGGQKYGTNVGGYTFDNEAKYVTVGEVVAW